LIQAILALLEVLKVPFEKEKSSDENKQVPNLPVLFNALRGILSYEIPFQQSTNDTKVQILSQYD
jgi:hypothetical protein